MSVHLNNHLPQTSITFFSETEKQPDHEHCPLCIASMIQPKEDTREPAIIFLSMDGVMTGDGRFDIGSTAERLFPEVEYYTNYHWVIAKAQHLHPTAIRYMRQLTERIEQAGKRALIVLSDSWANEATLQQHRKEVFVQREFCKYLCGKTAPRDYQNWTPECKLGFQFKESAEKSFQLKLANLAEVAKFWMLDHGFDPNSTRFVAINKDSVENNDALLKEHLVETSPFFDKKHFEQAVNILQV